MPAGYDRFTRGRGRGTDSRGSRPSKAASNSSGSGSKNSSGVEGPDPDGATGFPFATVARVSVRPLTPEILWRFRRAAPPVPAPDGSFAIVAVTDHPENDPITVLYRVVPGGDPRPLTSRERSSSSPAVSPDSGTVAFTRKPEGADHAQLALLPVDGGEARIVTDLPLGVADPRWLPDGSGVLFLAHVLREAPHVDATRDALEARKERRVTGKATEDRVYRFWDRWLSDGNVSHIMRYDLATDAVTDLLPGWTQWFDLMDPAGSWDVSPDGTEVAFAAAVVIEADGRVQAALFTAPTDGSGTAARVTDGDGNESRPRYSPDGALLVYGWQEQIDYYGEPWKLVRRDRATGEEAVLTAAWDRSAEQWEFAGDATLVLAAEDDARKHLYRMGLEPGVPDRIVEGGWVAGPRPAADGYVYYSYDTLREPADAWRVPLAGGDPQRLTSFNAELLAEVDLGDVEEVRFAGANGDEMQAWLVFPPGHDRAQPAPLVQNIHGGPHGIYGDHWFYRWNAQAFAAGGYVIAMVNFHGSSSWGADFAESIQGDWATMPAADVEAGTDHLVAAGLADTERMAIMGGSYGGYLVAWLIGHTDRYQAAVCHAGVTNLLGQYATDGTQGRERAMGAHAWEDVDKVLSTSPTANFEVLETPTLVIHGEKDYRVVVDQGLELYGMLKAKGVPARLLYYPDEGHWILRKPNSLQWYAEVLGWLGRWLA